MTSNTPHCTSLLDEVMKNKINYYYQRQRITEWLSHIASLMQEPIANIISLYMININNANFQGGFFSF